MCALSSLRRHDGVAVSTTTAAAGVQMTHGCQHMMLFTSRSTAALM